MAEAKVGKLCHESNTHAVGGVMSVTSLAPITRRRQVAASANLALVVPSPGAAGFPRKQ